MPQMVTSNAYVAELFMVNPCSQEAVMLRIILKSSAVVEVWKKENGQHDYWIKFHIT